MWYADLLGFEPEGALQPEVACAAAQVESRPAVFSFCPASAPLSRPVAGGASFRPPRPTPPAVRSRLKIDRLLFGANGRISPPAGGMKIFPARPPCLTAFCAVAGVRVLDLCCKTGFGFCLPG